METEFLPIKVSIQRDFIRFKYQKLINEFEIKVHYLKVLYSIFSIPK